MLACILLSMTAGGCLGQTETTDPGESQDDEAMDRDARLTTRIEAAARSAKQLPERAPIEESVPVEPVPDKILQDVKADLAARTGATVDDIEVASAESVTWGDGSMGCPKPGVFYTQVPVEGYRIVLRHAGKDYDYRAASRGWFVLCEHPVGSGAPQPPGQNTM